MRTVPSSSMSIWASNSSDSARIVSPPLPMTAPIFSVSIWICEMRGANWDSSARGSAIASLILPRIVMPGVLGLRERVAQDVERHARDLDVHLQGGDALGGAGDLEVHVAEVVLHARDVGEDDVVVALLDEAHRHTGHRRLDRHAGVHQRQRRAADRGHRARAVGLEDVRDHADRVREVLHLRHHRQRAPARPARRDRCRGAWGRA